MKGLWRKVTWNLGRSFIPSIPVDYCNMRKLIKIYYIKINLLEKLIIYNKGNQRYFSFLQKLLGQTQL